MKKFKKNSSYAYEIEALVCIHRHTLTQILEQNTCTILLYHHLRRANWFPNWKRNRNIEPIENKQTQHNTSTLPILTMIEPFFSCVTFFLPLATFYELISSSSLLLLLLLMVVVMVKSKRKTGWEATECNIKKNEANEYFSSLCACFSLQKIRSAIVLKWKLFNMRYDEINMMQILMVCKFEKFLFKYMHTEQCQCSQ